MNRISCSCVWGKGNLNHNLNKKSRASQLHIDKTKIDTNIILKNIDYKNIEQEFNKIFEDDISEYNKKQKRKDRQITNYYQKCLNDKKIKYPFREVIYQVGNSQDTKDPVKKDKMIKSLSKFYLEFEKNYPKMKVLSAVIHLDEATPHLHIDVVPYAEGKKNGLKHKVSFEKAIEQMGFLPEQSQVNKSSKKPLIFNGFRNHSMKLLENILNNESLEREIKNNTNKHIEPNEYREKMAIEDLKKDKTIQKKAEENIICNILAEMPELEKKNKILEEQNKVIDILLEENEQLKESISFWKKLYYTALKIFAPLKNYFNENAQNKIEKLIIDNSLDINEINRFSENDELYSENSQENEL